MTDLPPDRLKTGGALCAYTLLDSGIHRFVFKEATRAAADEYFELLDLLIRKLLADGMTPDDTVRVLTDFRASGSPPMNYMFNLSKALMSRYTVRPGSRFANVYQSSFLLSIAQAFVALLTRAARDKARIYAGERAYDDAIAWLLRDD